MHFARGDDAFAGVKVLSEVDERLMMMLGAGASWCAANRGGTGFSRLTEVTTTSVLAGYRRCRLADRRSFLSISDESGPQICMQKGPRFETGTNGRARRGTY